MFDTSRVNGLVDVLDQPRWGGSVRLRLRTVLPGPDGTARATTTDATTTDAAPDPVTDPQSADATDHTGHRCTRRLAEELLHLDPAEARRALRQTAALLPRPLLDGHERPPALPATAENLTDGRLSAAHVSVIEKTMRAVDRLTHLDPATREVVEEQLAALAVDRSPGALADAATEILALLDPDGAAPTDRDVPDNELRLLRRRNGSVVGTFRYDDPAAAQVVLTAIDAATPPGGADGDADAAEPLRTLAERRAQGFLDLAAEGLTRGVELDDSTGADDDRSERPATGEGALEDEAADPPWTRPETEGGERVHVAVTVDYELLRSRLAQASLHGHLPGFGRLDLTTPIGPETARRLACDADVIPAVLGAGGEPLDIGRRSRIIPSNVRTALVVRDRHCAHPGCRRRARKCAGHHVRHWAHGGDTALDNLVLLCSFHHALIHHGGWQITMHQGLPWFTPPRWLDRHRRPRHNRPWCLDDDSPSTE